jgi:hypothetical protein|tara:strand:+ start:3064 stop:3552 length:489 start_codon:yes stop_codon:yes gene_type:complete
MGYRGEQVINEQTCSYFSIKKGIYVGCKNPSEYMMPEEKKFPVDMCAMHNHMESTGIPVNCWRCGDDRKLERGRDEGLYRPTTLEKLQARGYTEEDLEMSNPYTQYEREDYGGEDKYEVTGDEPTLGEIVLSWASEFASKYPIPYPYTHPIREIPEHSKVRR